MAFDPEPSGHMHSIGYLVIGSAGAGKSSLVNLFTNGEAHVGHDASAGTKSIHIYQHTNGKDILIDTVGIEDPRGLSDEQNMIQTLKFLQKNKVQQIAIIWTIKPDSRASQQLQKQAQYINSLLPIIIWDSVIIIIKQSADIESHSQGALDTAKTYHKGASNIPCITYNCVDWLSPSARKKYEKKLLKYGKDYVKEDGDLDGNDVKIYIEQTLLKLKKESCQVIFSDSKCIKCGVVGDVRCMPEKCHTKMTKIHREDGYIDKKHEHTGFERTEVKDVQIHSYHSKGIEWFHPGCVIDSHTYFLMFEWNHQSKYDCCGYWETSKGCRQRYKCCGGNENSPGCKRERIETTETLMSCCNLPPNVDCSRAINYWTCCKEPPDSIGCVDVCQYCEKPWNDDRHPGCMSQSSHECEKR